MNEETNRTNDNATPVQNASEESVVSSVLSNIRQIFERTGDKNVPSAAGGECHSRIIIRNCSTKFVLASLVTELGDAGLSSGRYFVPRCQDLARIRKAAESRDLFVKESRLGDVTILDLMVDRTKHPFGDR